MRFLAVALIFSGVTASLAQTPEVPHKMHFADMTLTIRDDARREIQKDVDALTKSPKYFGIKVERARMYFPFIEKVFADPGKINKAFGWKAKYGLGESLLHAWNWEKKIRNK